MTSIAFQELTSVFDGKTWLCIIFVTIIFSIWVHYYRASETMLTQIISVFKMFLEQGGPFARSVLSMKNRRCMIGLLLLMGVVLSNAYKNSNIYNMVIPRRPILYKYFWELVRDKFIIFSRPSRIMLTNIMTHNRSDFVKINTKIANIDTYLVSEVTSTLDNHEGIVVNPYDLELKNSLSSAVINGTRMHTESIKKFSRYLEIQNFTERTKWTKVLHETDEIFTKMRVGETGKLFGIVEICQKTAVILPDHICRKLYPKSQLPDIFIGQENYSEMDWMFYFGGLVPPHFIRGVHQIAESGVWTWWTKLLIGGNIKRPNVNYVKAANMQGNIIIIFILWGVGICLANLCYCLECGKGVMLKVNWKFSTLEIDSGC